MKASDLAQVAVIGAGTMGAGIAGVFARAGCQVRLTDKSEDLLLRGMRSLAAGQRSLVEAGLLTKRAAAAALKRVRPVNSLAEACEGAQLVVEAVFEDLELKRRLFRECERLSPSGVILASNTSGLPITKIAAETKHPNRVAGMHFWNPPHVMPLVEITKGERTSNATAKFLVEVSRRLGKRPILVKRDIPGFVGNRLQFAVMREALYLLLHGVASLQDIDAAMTAGPGLRYAFLGPLRTADLGGLDVFRNISAYLFADLCSNTAPLSVLEKMVKEGRLGAKSGRGFYRYFEKDLSSFLARRDRVLLAFLKTLKQFGGD